MGEPDEALVDVARSHWWPDFYDITQYCGLGVTVGYIPAAKSKNEKAKRICSGAKLVASNYQAQ